MNRRNFLMSAVALAAGAAALAADAPATPEKPAAKPAEKPAPGKTALVAYYSWSGNTRALARHVADALGADLLEIRPKTPYPNDYGRCVAQAKAEIAKGHRPELEPLPDLSRYTLVVVGSPNWWGTLAPPVSAFVADPALAGKRMALFQTHGGGGMQRLERDFRAQAKGTVVGRALAVAGTRAAGAKEEAARWAATLR